MIYLWVISQFREDFIFAKLRICEVCNFEIFRWLTGFLKRASPEEQFCQIIYFFPEVKDYCSYLLDYSKQMRSFPVSWGFAFLSSLYLEWQLYCRCCVIAVSVLDVLNLNCDLIATPYSMMPTPYLMMPPGRVAQSVTCLATDACLTADPGVASSIPARYHTVVEIDHEIISTVILLPSADIQEGLLSVTSESMCTNYWLTACSSLPRKKCG